MPLRITCIDTLDVPDEHRRILHVGGGGPHNAWKHSQDQAIANLEADPLSYFVTVNGHNVRVVVATCRRGNKYLKTAADGTHENNLLGLPPCGP